MRIFKCGSCNSIQEEKYAINHPSDKIVWLKAQEENELDEEEKIKRSQNKLQKERDEDVEDLEKGRKAQDEEKDKMPMEKKLEEIAKALKKLMSQELDDDQLDELEKLQAKLHELEKLQDEINELKKDDEKKDSKHASKYNSSEFIGYDSTVKRSNYSVLNYSAPSDNKTSGDELLMRMGSTDDQSSTGNSSGDSLLKRLGSSN